MKLVLAGERKAKNSEVIWTNFSTDMRQKKSKLKLKFLLIGNLA